MIIDISTPSKRLKNDRQDICKFLSFESISVVLRVKS